MWRKFLLLLLACTLSVQSLGYVAAPDTSHDIMTADEYHDFLHFIGEPHDHDFDAPEYFQLSFSEDARAHVALDIYSSTSALIPQNALYDRIPVPGNTYEWRGSPLPDPYLRHVTPPPKA